MQLSPKQLDTVTRTVLGEAEGEGPDGMAAVANVIRNRTLSLGFPSDPSEVATQSNARGFHQFSAWNTPENSGNNLVNTPATPAEYQRAAAIVQGVFDGTTSDPTQGATYYHTINTHPDWERSKYATTQIGQHIFYSTVPPASPNSSGGPDDRALPPVPRLDPRNVAASAAAALTGAPIPRPRLQRQGADAIVDSVYGRAHELADGFSVGPPAGDNYGGFYPLSAPIPPSSVGPQSTGPRTALDAARALAQAATAPAPSAALGYAGDSGGGLGFGGPVMDTYRGASAGGVSQPGYGDPRLQQSHYYAQGPVNAAPLSPFESAMAGVRSSVIPKYIAVTHHVPNPDYVAQFGPIEPPMPDFVGMLASRLSRDPNANAGPSFAQAPGDFGSSPVGQLGDYLLDKTPPPLPPAPPLPILQDPEAIRALLVPALQALQNQRAAAAMQAGQPAYGANNGGLVPTTTTDGQARRSLWDDANGVGASLASRG